MALMGNQSQFPAHVPQTRHLSLPYVLIFFYQIQLLISINPVSKRERSGGSRSQLSLDRCVIPVGQLEGLPARTY